MRKKIAIIGAGISGLVFGNLLKKNLNFEFTIFEKSSELDLSEGYGIQLSSNSVYVLNNIGFKNLNPDSKFNPKKIDFYSLKKKNKICDLDISQFNSDNSQYTTLKRSSLINFFKETLLANSIQFSKRITKIKHFNSKIEITFNENITEVFDYLIVADGIFSSTKSILYNQEVKPKYFGSLAFRTLIDKKDLKLVNEKNICLFLDSNAHMVTYPVNNKNEINLVFILRKKLTQEILKDINFFNKKDNYMDMINNYLFPENENQQNLSSSIKDFKCFPIFVSDKLRKNKFKNTFFLGDAFFASPPTFAQGAAQSIEAAYELFNILNKNETNFDKYFIKRTQRVKMTNRRSKFNHMIFHISNPILILIRNIILKAAVTNRIFLKKYLGKIYLKKF